MDGFDNLCEMNAEIMGHIKRPVCERCRRPQSACWCPWLPSTRLPIQTHILIFQHPYEERRKVRTARILELALDEKHIQVVRGRKFNETRYPDLISTLSAQDSYVLYPHPEAVNADACKPVYNPSGSTAKSRWLVVLDGTWIQARQMLTGSSYLLSLPKVCLPPDPSTGEFEPSAFVVRRQPFPNAVSTVEAVARILDFWEPHKMGQIRPKNYYRTVLLQPLHRICEVQSAWKQINSGRETKEGEETVS
ncbi:unnamed protein product [Calicophoron daubneyi]|uniref:tRNA-uridine aminocarboxypropyltransferase n=1 Tax=Calicophoron daubneyi TaxID=300641 RepID=A0AAV2U0U0_CALDB